MNEVMKLIQHHRSVRSYTDQEISKELLTSILQVSQSASTSSNLQAYSIIVVRDKEKKSKLAELCGNQRYIEECPVFLAFCGDLSRIDYCGTKHGRKAYLDNTEPFLMASVDAALLAQNVLLAAESEGLGGVFIGGIRNNSQEVSDLLKLPDLVYPVFGMCIGYPEPSKLPGVKPRLPLEAIVHDEEYIEAKKEKYIEEYDRTMLDYYRNRPQSARDESWSAYVSKVYEKPKRMHLKEFLEKRKFGLK